VKRAVSAKNGTSHRRVVHTGNRQTHDGGGNELLPKIRGSECQAIVPPSTRRSL
jgi:hypothetical protein